MTPSPIEKSTNAYWSELWSASDVPAAIDPTDRSLRNHVNIAFHNFFRGWLAGASAPRSLVELGAARSAWLPCFHKQYGLDVTGIDYSEVGCEQSRQVLAHSQVPGEVYCADVFAPPPDLMHRFDAAFSMGLVEHFSDTSACLRACASFVRPGGILITVIPNMRGAVGLLQRLLVRAVYDIHIPLTAADMAAAHAQAGLSVLECRYFLFLSFGVVNLDRIRGTGWGLFVARGLNALSMAVWWLERLGLRLPPTWFLSPYIVCVARV